MSKFLEKSLDIFVPAARKYWADWPRPLGKSMYATALMSTQTKLGKISWHHLGVEGRGWLCLLR